jgi:uncharacterized protein GlcG (DUF336 family)
MSIIAFPRLAVALACALSAPASAQVLTQKNVSTALAVAMAQAAVDACAAQGYRVSVHVVDRSGETKLGMRGDEASPHTFENSRRKAYTARTIRVPSGEFAKRVSDPAGATARAQATLPGMIALAGALPIKVGDEVIGAIGVSGAPGGERDEVCAQAGIDKVAGQLR